MARLPAADDDGNSAWRRRRWVACGLAGPPGPSAPTAAGEVARLGCVQAQEFDMTLWSLTQRTGSPRAVILADLAGGEFLRTHAMRPTWHFVHRDDLARVQAATRDRVHLIARPVLTRAGLGEAELAEWAAWLTQQLRPGPLARDELRERLADSTFRFDSLTLVFALMWAELEMIIASGPPRGLTQTYQLLPTMARPDREASITWLIETFLASHGPSSVADISAWSGLTMGAVRRAVAELGPAVSSAHELGSVRHWIGPLDDRGWAQAPTIELLNPYDEYVSGLHPRSKSHLDPQGLYRQRPRTPNALLMIDGALAGHWRRTATARTVRISLQLLRPLSPAEATALEDAADRYARFTGLPATVDVDHL